MLMSCIHSIVRLAALAGFHASGVYMRGSFCHVGDLDPGTRLVVCSPKTGPAEMGNSG
jgi:hypothetical protein